MLSEKINYSFYFFFLMNWPQICNENIFCRAERMDQDIFNQFLITETSDSKPWVPDLVPAWTWFLPPPPGSGLQVLMWPKQGGFQGAFFSQTLRSWWFLTEQHWLLSIQNLSDNFSSIFGSLGQKVPKIPIFTWRADLHRDCRLVFKGKRQK